MRLDPLYKLLLIGFSTIALSPASAATTTGVMAVAATALNACVVAATPLAFGTISQLGGSANDSTATITVTCTPGTTYAVGLDQGLHAGGGVRQMEGALSTNLLPYTLYSNASRTVAWGNAIGTDTVTGTATLLPAALTVYGRIPGGAPLATAGVYTDAVTVTVSF